MRNRFPDIRLEKRPWITEFANLKESEIAYDLLFSNHSKEISWIILNKLDVFNLKWLDDNDLEVLINDLLKEKKETIIWDNWEIYEKHITIDMPEWISIINSLFHKSLYFFENTLKWRLLKEYSKAHDNYFKDKKDVIKFLKDTQNWIKRSQMNCTIAKIAYSINEIIDNPELLELDKKAQYFLQRNVMPWVIVDDFDSLINFWISKWRAVIKWKTVEFNIRYRPKSWDSSATKIIKDFNYLKATDIKDLIWID